MARIVAFVMVTADGYFEGKENDISWHRVDTEVNEYSIRILQESGTLLFGRKTFQLLRSFWSTPEAFEKAPVVSQIMRNHQKLICSTTLKEAGWVHCTIFNHNVIKMIADRKQESIDDILVLGSASLVNQLIAAELLDEIRLMVNPVVLGAGTVLFNSKCSLQLHKAKVFGNGCILQCYYLNYLI